MPDQPLDPRSWPNVVDIHVTHTLHSSPRTIVRLVSREPLELGDPLYINPDTLELTRICGDPSEVGVGTPVGIVTRVDCRDVVEPIVTVDGTVYQYAGQRREWRAEAEIHGRPLLVAHQARHVLDTETTAPPCQPFASPPARGPSELAAGLRAHLERELFNAFFCPEHAPGADSSDDPLENR